MRKQCRHIGLEHGNRMIKQQGTGAFYFTQVRQHLRIQNSIQWDLTMIFTTFSGAMRNKINEAYPTYYNEKKIRNNNQDMKLSHDLWIK